MVSLGGGEVELVLGLVLADITYIEGKINNTGVAISKVTAELDRLKGLNNDLQERLRSLRALEARL